MYTKTMLMHCPLLILSLATSFTIYGMEEDSGILARFINVEVDLLKSRQWQNSLKVSQCDAVSMTVDLDEPIIKTMEIKLLDDGIATALYIKCTDGAQFAGMTHYPLNNPSHIAVLTGLIKDGSVYSDKSYGVESAYFFVLVPGEHEKQQGIEKLVPDKRYQVDIKSLSTIVNNTIGIKANGIISYDTGKKFSAKNDHFHAGADFTISLGRGKCVLVLDKNKSYEKIEL